MNSKEQYPPNDNPVIIVGAGPAGLLAALVLEQHGQLPFVLLERAAPSKICSNSGSGYDLAPTAMSIMRERLGLSIEGAFPRYEHIHVGNMGHDAVVRQAPSDAEEYGASRSTMQHFFLEALLGEENWKEMQRNKKGSVEQPQTSKQRTQSGMGELRCGAGVTGYSESDEHVTVRLDDGSDIVGSVVLGCDGIHSSIRRRMVKGFLKKGEEDTYHYCNINCYWGKTELHQGSELHHLLDDHAKTLTMLLGSSEHPGTFFLDQTEREDVFNWALCLHGDAPPKKSSDDLTRRGGFVLDEKDKEDLQQIVQNYSPLLKLIIEETPAHQMTNVGLYDRDNLNLPYSTNKRVALLGDAAHPQSPFMGQGCNMALTDAYVLATRLCHQSASVSEVLEAYDTEARRRDVNKVIHDARYYGNVFVSNHWFTCWALRFVMKYMPISWMLQEMTVGGDQPNADFVKEMHADLGMV